MEKSSYLDCHFPVAFCAHLQLWACTYYINSVKKRVMFSHEFNLNTTKFFNRGMNSLLDFSDFCLFLFSSMQTILVSIQYLAVGTIKEIRLTWKRIT